MDDQMSTSSGGAGSTPMTEQVKQQAGEVIGQAKETGGKLAGKAKEQVKSSISSQKEQAASSLDSVAIALRQSVDSLRGDQENGAAGMMEAAAGAVESVSTYLRDHDIEDMGREVEDFARRQPAAFLGGAFALGFLAARFLKSGGGSSAYSGSNGGYSTGYQSDTEGSSYYSGAPSGQDAIYGAGTSSSPAGSGATGMGSDLGGYGGSAVTYEDTDETADELATRSTYSS